MFRSGSFWALALVLATTGRALAGPADAQLSPAQHQKLAELRLGMMRKVAPLRVQLEVKHGELQLLWMVAQPDRSAILKKLGELHGLQQKLVEAQVDHDLAILKVLTPAQRILFAPRGPRGPGGGPGIIPPPPGLPPPPPPPGL